MWYRTVPDTVICTRIIDYHNCMALYPATYNLPFQYTESMTHDWRWDVVNLCTRDNLLILKARRAHKGVDMHNLRMHTHLHKQEF